LRRWSVISLSKRTLFDGESYASRAISQPVSCQLFSEEAGIKFLGRPFVVEEVAVRNILFHCGRNVG